MTKKKILFKNLSIFLCLVPMLLLSLFCLVPKHNVKSVNGADNVVQNYNFIGSNVNFATTIWRLSGSSLTFDRYAFASLTFTFSLNDGVYSAGVTGYSNRTTLNSTTPTSNAITPFSVSNLGIGSSDRYSLTLSSDTSYRFHMSITRFGNIGNNINRVRFYNTDDGGNIYNHVCYYDVDNNYIDFAIYCTINSYASDSLPINFAFVDRTYYINLDFSNNTYYEAGYTNGYNQGITDGASSGYQEGYEAGESIGYGNGYSDGIEQGGNYSFVSLIGAVIDAPVSAFTSLLNFEILGVNILGFISGLLTLALIIFIIKLCLGGK